MCINGVALEVIGECPYKQLVQDTAVVNTGYRGLDIIVSGDRAGHVPQVVLRFIVTPVSQIPRVVI